MTSKGAAERASSAWIGKVLRDGWRVDAKIARGGVATVFRASNGRGDHAAIKILHPELTNDADVRQRFLREGFAANAVEHPGVVRVLSTDVADDGSAYLVMELLDGELLEDRRLAAGGTMPLAEVGRIVDQLLDVLAAAHDKGIVHRDIKPENLLVLRDGTLKVLDFGIAHMKNALAQEGTATGLLLGTPDYMAPEQALGKRGHIDAQTDLWAVGATLFMLLSGKPVHDAANVSSLLVAAASRPARSLGSVAKQVPRPVVVVTDKALVFERHKRWPTARAMKDALREAIAQVSSSAQLATAPVSSPAVNDDKKASHSRPDLGEVHPDRAQEVTDTDAPDAPTEENPWDDDESGRTITTDGPTFDLPSNVPSPITVPPPPMAPPPPPAAPAPVAPKVPPHPMMAQQTAPAFPPVGPKKHATMLGFGPPAPPLPPSPAPPPAKAATMAFGVMPPRVEPPPLQASALVPESGSDLSAAAAAAIAAGPPPSARRPAPPRPMNAPSSGRMPAAPPPSARMQAAPPAPPAPPPPAPPAPPEEDEWPNADQDDGPTMAIAAPAIPNGALRDDFMSAPQGSPLASTGYVNPPSAFRKNDADAETMAGDPLVPLNEPEETTRAVSREEMMRHQDAHVVVGEDAHGDEATLAVAPGQIDLGPGRAGIAAALAETLQNRESSSGERGASPAPMQMPMQSPGTPAFPPPPHAFQQQPQPYLQPPQHAPPQQQQPPWGTQDPSSVPPSFQGFGVQSAPPEQMHPGGYPSSGPHPAAATNALGPGGYPLQQQQQQRPMQQPLPGQPPPWMTQASPQDTSGPSRFTPQVIMLVAVGAVCLAIFIIGIVLFVTTKF